ncbi:MAG: ComF family protein [Steroidobacteraceae bacterium]
MACQLNWRNLVDSAGRTLQRMLWPPRCLLCGGAGQLPSVDICRDCEADLVPLDVACVHCAQPLLPVAATLTCGHCLRRPPSFDRSFCAFRYEAPLAELVRGFKYRRDTASGRLLAHLFCKRLQSREGSMPDCIVPVPLAQQRYHQRGFNQAIELGTQIERRIGVPMRTDVIVRVRETSEQAGLKPGQRRRNVRRAFEAVKPLQAARVAVLDDVMTTGSTVNEVARVLRTAGALEIEVWAIARAGRDAHALS